MQDLYHQPYQRRIGLVSALVDVYGVLRPCHQAAQRSDDLTFIELRLRFGCAYTLDAARCPTWSSV